jgi:cation:H+ antiporter
MLIGLHLFLLAGGLTVALAASDRAVTYTRALAAQLGAPAFIVGVVLVSIGTDLPEIANSIAAHVQGEGDINVGDSVGSALTQYTLVLGLFPLAAVIVVDRRQVVVVSALTIGGLALTAALVADGWLGRWEGGLLVLAWAAFSWAVVKALPGLLPESRAPAAPRRRLVQAGAILLALGLVGFGATVAVRSLVRLAELAGVPKFVIAFFGASLGTSAPELVVDFTALLRGSPGIALGDVLGSSMVDATLAIGVGPIVAPAPVTARLAVVGSLYALVAVAAVGVILAVRRRHDLRSGVVFIGLYLLAYLVLLGFGGLEE